MASLDILKKFLSVGTICFGHMAGHSAGTISPKLNNQNIYSLIHWYQLANG